MIRRLVMGCLAVGMIRLTLAIPNDRIDYYPGSTVLLLALALALVYAYWPTKAGKTHE